MSNELRKVETKESTLIIYTEWEKKQLKLVEDNPFIEIVDAKTFKLAKERRTNYVKGRTELQDQEKTVVKKLKEVRVKAGEDTKKLIELAIEHERKQQAEVKRYEDLKAAEKLEKQRLIDEEAARIKTEQEAAEAEIKRKIQEDLDKSNQLREAELKKEADRIQAEKEKFKSQQEAIKKANEEAEALRRAEERKKQDVIDARNKAIQDELNKKKEELNKEAARIKKIQDDIIAEERKANKEARLKEEKEAKEAKDKEDEKQRLKRVEELKPDKDKVLSFIRSLSFKEAIPDVNDRGCVMILEGIVDFVKGYKNEIEETIYKIK